MSNEKKKTSEELLESIKKVQVLPLNSEIDIFLKSGPSKEQITQLEDFVDSIYKTIKNNPKSAETVMSSKSRLNKIKKFIKSKNTSSLPLSSSPSSSSPSSSSSSPPSLSPSSSSSSSPNSINSSILQQTKGKLRPPQQTNVTTISNPPLSPPTATGIKATVTIPGKSPSTFTVIPDSTSSGGKRKSHKRKHHKKSHTRRHMRKKSHKRRH